MVSPDGDWWKNILCRKRQRNTTFVYRTEKPTKVAGIGNIMLLKHCFDRISPELRCCDLSDMQWSTLATQIESVVEYSMKQHRSMRLQEQKHTKNIRNFSGVLHLVSEGKHRADGYLIYGRLHEICPQCEAAHIKKTKVGSQPLYWCPNCQRTS